MRERRYPTFSTLLPHFSVNSGGALQGGSSPSISGGVPFRRMYVQHSIDQSAHVNSPSSQSGVFVLIRFHVFARAVAQHILPRSRRQQQSHARAEQPQQLPRGVMLNQRHDEFKLIDKLRERQFRSLVPRPGRGRFRTGQVGRLSVPVSETPSKTKTPTTLRTVLCVPPAALSQSRRRSERPIRRRRDNRARVVESARRAQFRACIGALLHAASRSRTSSCDSRHGNGAVRRAAHQM
jgi:hypothetical protein